MIADRLNLPPTARGRSSGNAQQDDAYAKRMGAEVRAAIRAEVADVMTQQLRSGGMFRKMMKG